MHFTFPDAHGQPRLHVAAHVHAPSTPLSAFLRRLIVSCVAGGSMYVGHVPFVTGRQGLKAFRQRKRTDLWPSTSMKAFSTTIGPCLCSKPHLLHLSRRLEYNSSACVHNHSHITATGSPSMTSQKEQWIAEYLVHGIHISTGLVTVVDVDSIQATVSRRWEQFPLHRCQLILLPTHQHLV